VRVAVPGTRVNRFEELSMNEQQQVPGESDEAGKARHGYRNEVNWEGGSGRQPYSNQGTRETPSPGAASEVAEGNRGARSAENLDQMDEARRKA
jgi:hypothetical protein